MKRITLVTIYTFFVLTFHVIWAAADHSAEYWEYRIKCLDAFDKCVNQIGVGGHLIDGFSSLIGRGWLWGDFSIDACKKEKNKCLEANPYK
jgi:uncharacterized membrane protein